VGRLLSYLGIVPAGHFLDVPNALLGAVYYSYLLLLVGIMPPLVTDLIVTAAMSSTVLLAYQLTFVVKELCILCWSTHVINTLLLYKLVWTKKHQQDAAKKSKGTTTTKKKQ